jgi:hypothetical protein
LTSKTLSAPPPPLARPGWHSRASF